MGGGDLNLKKSWHPQTFKNQKRVWEAEQADAAERRKLAELQREIQNERNCEDLKRIGQSSGVLAADNNKNKLEWMYKSTANTLNREDYLTGRSIDKTFEKHDAAEREKEKQNLVGVTAPINHVEHECIPFSIRAFQSAPDTEDQVDMQRKMMEDPLMAIRQREMDSRKKLLENPVKLKEIHRLLEADKKLKTSSHKSKKKSKKSKKSKKKRSQSSSNSDSDSDLDAALAKKYKTMLSNEDKMTDKMGVDKLFNEKYEKLSKELDKMRKSKKSKKSKSKKKNCDSSDSDSSEDEQDSRKKRQKSKERDEKRHRSVDRQKRSPSREQTSRRRQRSRSPQKSGTSGDNSRHLDRDRRSEKDKRSERDRRSDNDRYSERDRRTDKDRRSERDRRSDNDRHSERDRRTDKDRRSERDRHSNNDRHSARDRRTDRDRHSSNRQERKRTRSRSKSASRKQFKSDDHPKMFHDKKSRTPEGRPVRTAELPPNLPSNNSGSDSSSDSPDNENVHKPTRNFGLVTASGDKIELKNKEPIKRASPVRREPEKKNPFARPASSAPKAKLTEDERQARIREMQTNAQWHEKEQTISRRRHEKTLANDKQEEQNMAFDTSYIHKEMNKALNNQGSVEARIKSNVNNIQRMSSSMQSHFTRK